MDHSQTVLPLRGEFTVFTARDLKEQIMTAMENCPGALDIDLADVTEIDTAGLQLMLLARREAEAAGVALRFVRPSAEVLDVLALCGFAGELGATLVLPPASVKS